MTKPYRLPTHARPTLYDLHITARVGVPTFTGQVHMHLHLASTTDRIELHARDLHLQHAMVDGVSARIDPDAEREMVALVFPQALPVGDVVLSIEYDGHVSANMEGLYLSKDGAEECLATQCEETDARGIFPCFDEPAFKARVLLTVTTTPDVLVLANAPLASTDQAGDLKTWRFQPTQVMSSYLFALVIGKVASAGELVVRGVPLRVYAMEGKETLGAYGNEFAASLLPWFEDYFGARYHFDKYDQVAVPSFSAGAMENSGLVIFRQTLLLRDPKTTSYAAEKLIARVIAHEFAHQWFGNLVTMAWWDDIWLNESFAEWMAHKAADAVAPDYGFWADFQDNKREALVTDALETTHAIYTPVETPEEATELFEHGHLQQRKRAHADDRALPRRRRLPRGPSHVHDGIDQKNAKGDDLWRHLGLASGQPVTKLAQSWILQPGYPVVSARLEGTTLLLAQRRCFSKPDGPKNSQTWAIPLVIRFADDAGVHEVRHLLEAREGELRIEPRGQVKWLHSTGTALASTGRTSHPRCARSSSCTRGISRQPSSATSSTMRGRSPAPARSRTSQASSTSSDPVVGAAKDHHVLGQAVASFERIEEIIAGAHDGPAIAKSVRGWVGALLAREAKRLGYAPRAGEPRDDSERRAALLRAMARHARDPSALAAARLLAEEELRDPASVEARASRDLPVALAARFGDMVRHGQHVAVFEKRGQKARTRSLRNAISTASPPSRTRKCTRARWRCSREGAIPARSVRTLLRLMLVEPRGQQAGVGTDEGELADGAPPG